jgi:hypothetical protein
MNMIRTSIFLSIALVLSASFVLAQTPEPAGTWAGAMTTNAGPGGLEITLAREGAAWKASAKVRLEGQEAAPPVNDLQVNGPAVVFAVMLDRTLVKINAKIEGDKLTGTLEAFQGDRKVGSGTIALTRNGQMPPLQRAQGGQMADPNFDAKVAHPAYTRAGPKVLFDEAHHNFHTAGGRYKPFADLITNDGYRVTPNKEKFSPATLQGFDILVISNAIGTDRMNAPEAANPAFSAEECDAVRDWIKRGGKLLLIADHAPMGSANQILADRFGVNMSKMYTVDEQNFDKESENPGFIVYTRESGRLADHAITRGRNQTERINKIIAFTGQSLKGPVDSIAFMKLADTANDLMPGQNPTPTSAAGRAQGIAMAFGKGRLVILGEAAMLTAQVTGPNRMPFGMNRPGLDNKQMALNIMHWLSRLLK